jgi:phosphoglycerol transferase
VLTDTPARPASAVAVTGPPSTTSSAAVRPSARQLLAEVTVVGVVAVVIAAWLFQVWKRTLSVPFENVYDARQAHASVKTIIEHGLFSSNSSLGAPFGRDRFDWPVAGEMLQRTAIWVMSWFTSRFGIIVNAYFLLGFGFVAATAHAVLRVLRFPVLIAAAGAILYAFLPYHFFHAEGHLLRAAYFSAPLAVLVILAVLGFRGWLLRDPDGALWPLRPLWANVVHRRAYALLAVVVLIAVSETMTTFFTVTVLVLAGVLVAVRDRSPAVLVPVGVVVAALGMVYALALVPNLVYWAGHGRNAQAVQRLPIDQENYGLRPSQLFLPIENHRVSALRDLQVQANDRSPVPSEGGQELGVLGALGLLVVLGALVTRGIPYRARAQPGDRATLLRHGGLVTLILILVGTVSGLAMLLALAGVSEVRTWNRVVVLIAFFALLPVLMALEWLVARLRSARPVVAGVVVVAVVAFGLWDTARPLRIDQRAEVPVNEAMQSVVRRIERTLPRDAAVFQLPVIPYPEYAPHYGRVYDYEELLPYLWSTHLRWSYGATKGRPEADWQRHVSSADPATSLAGLVGLGFDGLLMDTYVYDDGGSAAMASLVPVLGPPTITAGPDSRFRFWDLRGYARSAGLSAGDLRDAARRLVGPALLARLPSGG